MNTTARLDDACDRCGHHDITVWTQHDGGGLLTFCDHCARDQADELRIAGFQLRQ